MPGTEYYNRRRKEVVADELTQDEVLAQLRTRGFESGFERTPLRDFWGKLDTITGEMRQGQRGMYLVAFYNFSEVEVIYSIEPYESPIAQIEIAASTRQKSRAGYFGASVDKIINAGLPPDVLALIPDPSGAVDAAGKVLLVPNPQVKTQSYLLNKILHMAMTPGHMVWNQNAGAEQPIDCWELMEIRGEVAPAPQPAPGTPATSAPAGAAQQAKALLDGLTEQQWLQKAFGDPVIKADQELVNSIIGRVFLPGLETAGLVEKDANGVYHVKG